MGCIVPRLCRHLLPYEPPRLSARAGERVESAMVAGNSGRTAWTATAWVGCARAVGVVGLRMFLGGTLTLSIRRRRCIEFCRGYSTCYAANTW